MTYREPAPALREAPELPVRFVLRRRGLESRFGFVLLAVVLGIALGYVGCMGAYFDCHRARPGGPAQCTVVDRGFDMHETTFVPTPGAVSHLVVDVGDDGTALKLRGPGGLYQASSTDEATARALERDLDAFALDPSALSFSRRVGPPLYWAWPAWLATMLLFAWAFRKVDVTTRVLVYPRADRVVVTEHRWWVHERTELTLSELELTVNELDSEEDVARLCLRAGDQRLPFTARTADVKHVVDALGRLVSKARAERDGA